MMTTGAAGLPRMWSLALTGLTSAGLPALVSILGIETYTATAIMIPAATIATGIFKLLFIEATRGSSRGA